MSTIKKIADASIAPSTPSAEVLYNLWQTNDQGLRDEIYGPDRAIAGATPGHNHGEQGGEILVDDRPLVSVAFGPFNSESAANSPQVGTCYGILNDTTSTFLFEDGSSKLLAAVPVLIPGGVEEVLVRLSLYAIGSQSIKFYTQLAPLTQSGYRSLAVGAYETGSTLSFTGTRLRKADITHDDLSALGDPTLDRLCELRIYQALSSTVEHRLCGAAVYATATTRARPAMQGDPPQARLVLADIIKGAITPELTAKLRQIENGHAIALLGRAPGLHPDGSPDRTRSYLQEIEGVHLHQGPLCPLEEGGSYPDGEILPWPLVTASYPRSQGEDGSGNADAYQARGLKIHPTDLDAATWLHLRYRCSIPSGLFAVALRFALMPGTSSPATTCRVRVDVRPVGSDSSAASIVSRVSSGPYAGTAKDTDGLVVCSVDPIHSDLYVPNRVRQGRGQKLSLWSQDARLPESSLPAGAIRDYAYRISEPVVIELTNPLLRDSDAYRPTQDYTLHLRVQLRDDDQAAYDTAARLLWVQVLPMSRSGLPAQPVTPADRSTAPTWAVHAEPAAGGGGGTYTAGNGLQLSGSQFAIDTSITVDKNSTQTLTNKTLTAPVLSGTVTGTYALGGTPSLGVNLDANSKKITGLQQATASGDAVHAGRSISTSTGLSGGGNLTADRTLSVDTAVIAKICNIQDFTASGTWTMPSGAKIIDVIVIASGGGAGSGRRGASLSNRYGGSGGGGGGISRKRFLASFLPSSVTITVGTGGPGGSAVTADNTNGSDGTDGGDSGFGTYVRATGGKKGKGGTTASQLGGAGGYGIWEQGPSTPAGQQSGTGGNSNSNGESPSATPRYPLGGGGGGTINSSNTLLNGGDGGDVTTVTADLGGPWNGGTGGTSSGSPTAGGAGEQIDSELWTGPGGGGASRTAAAKEGGNGATNSGCGGGGGGASENGFNSGGGGNGADGRVIVITYF